MLGRFWCLAALLPGVPAVADTSGAATSGAGAIANTAVSNGVAASAIGSGVSTASPLTVVFGLAFIVVLIFACAWLMKRLGAAHLGGVSGMKLVAGLSVGPREKVLLVEVGGKQVLIGVAPGRISHLQSFDERVIESTGAEPGDFSRRLKSLMTPDKAKTGSHSERQA